MSTLVLAGRRAGSVVWELVLPVGLVLAYQWWASSAQDPYFPTIPAIADAFGETWIGAGFREDVVPSLTNVAFGWVGGVVLGVAGGLVLGRVTWLRRSVSPLVAFSLTLPAVALLPLFLTVLGIGQRMQVGVILYAVLFYVLVSTTDAVRDTEPALLDSVAVYRVRGWRRVLLVLLPASAPQILAAARVTLSLAVLVMVVSEMVGASHGIGAKTLLAQQSFDYEGMWAGMVLVAILGYAANALFSLAERALLRRLGLQHTESGKGAL